MCQVEISLVCAWCGDWIRKGGEDPVSHGMCVTCYTEVKEDLSRLSPAELRRERADGTDDDAGSVARSD